MCFPNLSRRGFMVAASALVATVSQAMNLNKGIVSLIETDKEAPVEKANEWITDRGDFYIVRVPEGKTFSKHDFDKSVVFYLEHQATVSMVSVMGFTNLILESDAARFTDGYLDCSNTKLASGKERACMVVDNRSKSGQSYISHVNLKGSDIGIEFAPSYAGNSLSNYVLQS